MLLQPATAFLITLLCFGSALWIFPRVGLLDFPERYGLKRARLPYPTGIVPIMVFMAFFASTMPWSGKNLTILAAILLLGIVCVIDDRRPLPAWLRLATHVVVASAIFAAGARIYTITNPLGGILKLDSFVIAVPSLGSLPVLSGVVTIAWLLLTINALNWFDGITGQVSVVSTLGFTLIGFLALLRNNEPEIALLAFTLAGIAGAGIVFDFPPARMLIGDTGAMFFGLMLGVLGVYQGGKIATVFLALGIPLADALAVVIRRIMRGASPFVGGNDHWHHLMLLSGFGQRTIVLITACTGLVFGTTALFLSTPEKVVSGLILLITTASTTILLQRKYQK